MDFTFFMPVRLLSGEGCLEQNGVLLREMGRRCLIVTGGSGAERSGALVDALRVLEAQGIEATVYPNIGQNPRTEECQQAALAAEACRAEWLLGIGGGSVMDATKAVAWLANNRVSETERLFACELRHPPLPFALVGTTAGTGSEVSPVAVLTDRGRKRSITHPYCYARYAFADPRYTCSMPRGTTVSTALDALAHTVEGWFAPGCGDIVTLFGERAITLLSEGLGWLSGHEGVPDYAMREKLYYGSLYAGVVLGACGTGFPHPFSYILTEDFSVPHGMGCAVFLPAFTERAEQFAPDRAARLFTLFGGREKYFGVLSRLVEAEVRMTRDQVAVYAKRWEGLRNFTRTPGGFTPELGIALFQKLFCR